MAIKDKMFGILQNKVSRRIALGSMATGLGGAALVIRALRGRYNVAVPSDAKFATEWDKYVKMLDVPIEDINGPASFTLDYRPVAGMKSGVVLLNAIYDAHSYPATYPKPPRFYTITDGRIAVGSPVVDAIPSLAISVEKRFTQHRRLTRNERAMRDVVLSMSGNGTEYYDVRQGTPQKVPATEVNEACTAIGERFGLTYPKGTTLEKGAKWTIPPTSLSAIEIPCEIVGFASVGGTETVKILAEKRLDTPELSDAVAHNPRRAKDVDQSRGSDKRVDHVQKAIDGIVEARLTRDIHLTVYVDRATGLVVRYESREVTQNPKAGSPPAINLSIMQIIRT